MLYYNVINIILLLFSHYVVFDSVTPWTAAHQASLYYYY